MSFRPRAVPPRARVVVVLVVASLVATALAVLGGSAASARPSAKPRTIDEVSALLDRLSQQNEHLDEQYNVAVLASHKQRRIAERAQRDARAAERAARRARNSLSVAAAERYEAGSADSTGPLLTSADPQHYLNNLSSMDYLSAQFSMLASDAVATAKHATVAAKRAASALADARSKVRAVRTQRTKIEARSAHFKKVLAQLTEEQRRRYEHARQVALAKAQAIADAAAAAQAHTFTAPVHKSAPVPVQPVSGSVQSVIDYARAQVGKGYSYGSSGPDYYDCSGLTMASWAQAGINLPHSSEAQYNVGRHVSYDELQPGDLIFLYQPISHVEIYVGNDLAVSAANEATGVVYVHPSQDMGNYVGATRPQG